LSGGAQDSFDILGDPRLVGRALQDCRSHH
jgi:hypothetical protein